MICLACITSSQEFDSSSEDKSKSKYKIESENEPESNSGDGSDNKSKGKIKYNVVQSKNEYIVELADNSLESSSRVVSGMALAGCPSSKDVARIASQKSMDKSELEYSEEDEEETSEEESEEDDDPKLMEEKHHQRDIKLMKTKIRNFKLV